MFLIFREWYEPHAVLMQEEGTVISGLLVGINIIDCNFDLKGDSLDAWVRIFSYEWRFQPTSILNFPLYSHPNYYLLAVAVG